MMKPGHGPQNPMNEVISTLENACKLLEACTTGGGTVETTMPIDEVIKNLNGIRTDMLRCMKAVDVMMPDIGKIIEAVMPNRHKKTALDLSKLLAKEHNMEHDDG